MSPLFDKEFLRLPFSFKRHTLTTIWPISGYKDKLDENFFGLDEGLASRFAETFTFPSEGYTAPELAQIFALQLERQQSKWRQSANCRAAVEELLAENIDLFQQPKFMNGRGVETMVTRATRQQAKRQDREFHLLEKIDLVNALVTMRGGNPVHRHVIRPPSVTSPADPTSNPGASHGDTPTEDGTPLADGGAAAASVQSDTSGMAYAVGTHLEELEDLKNRATQLEAEVAAQRTAVAEQTAVAEAARSHAVDLEAQVEQERVATEAQAAVAQAERQRADEQAALALAAQERTSTLEIELERQQAALDRLEELRLEERRRHRETLQVMSRAVTKLDKVELFAMACVAIAAAVLLFCALIPIVGIKVAVAAAAITATSAVLFPETALACWKMVRAALGYIAQVLWSVFYRIATALARWAFRWLGPRGQLLLIVLGVLAVGVALRVTVAIVTDPITLCCIVTIGFGLAQIALCHWVRDELKAHHDAALEQLDQEPE